MNEVFVLVRGSLREGTYRIIGIKPNRESALRKCVELQGMSGWEDVRVAEFPMDVTLDDVMNAPLKDSYGFGVTYASWDEYEEVSAKASFIRQTGESFSETSKKRSSEYYLFVHDITEKFEKLLADSVLRENQALESIGAPHGVILDGKYDAGIFTRRDQIIKFYRQERAELRARENAEERELVMNRPAGVMPWLSERYFDKVAETDSMNVDNAVINVGNKKEE